MSNTGSSSLVYPMGIVCQTLIVCAHDAGRQEKLGQNPRFFFFFFLTGVGLS